MRAAGLCAIALCGAVTLTAQAGDPIFGFTAERSAAQRAREKEFRASVSAERIREMHRYLAAEPHLAGSPRDLELAEWTRDQFRTFGLEEVEIVTHDVLLPYAQEVSVEMVAPKRWRASMREEPIPGDEYTRISASEAGIPYHAYSASGEVTAPVVYAGSGNPSDYDALLEKGIDIKGKIALVRYSVPYSYRGFKAMTAERRGAAGILIYSDAEDDGAGKGPVYPDGPWGPESHIQRGAIVYDFLVPGDPLTPGWASLPGARRIDKKDAVSLPRIISAPMSHKDAQVLLNTPGAVVRLRVKADDEVRPIWTVTGMIRGSERPEELVILGNHRDAWIYGGVDPSSGSAALMELARTLGAQVKKGWRPRRSILFASWDAEEFTLTSSTEWGEQFEDRLKRGAVAYLNVDSAASGPNFSAASVPALNRLIAETADDVPDPRGKGTIADATRAATKREGGTLPTGGAGELTNNRLGSGSDYTVFLNFIGVPVADLAFDGPYGVYHSIYDNHHWVSRIGDPGFVYHVAMVQLWGALAMRLADADAIPLDYEPYAAAIEEFAREVEARWKGREGALGPVLRAAAGMKDAAAALNTARTRAIAAGDAAALADINRRLMAVERALLEPDGIPGRPWYRHQIYAPKFTYAPELLPAIAEAIEQGDDRRAEAQVRRVAATIDRAAAALRGR